MMKLIEIILKASRLGLCAVTLQIQAYTIKNHTSLRAILTFKITRNRHLSFFQEVIIVLIIIAIYDEFIIHCHLRGQIDGRRLDLRSSATSFASSSLVCGKNQTIAAETLRH